MWDIDPPRKVGSTPTLSTNSPRKALSYDEAADRVKTAIIWVIDAIG